MTEQNLIKTVDGLLEKGYQNEMSWHQDHIHIHGSDVKVQLDDIYVDAAYRFECSDKEEDCAAVFAVSSPKHNIKGLILDYFDQLTDNQENPVVAKLLSSLKTVRATDDKIPMRYNLRKVFKEDFEKNPANFILRVGYPDFPKCPFGNTFKMLGYDKQNKEYVWLTTSILKDKRLETINYV